MLKDTFIAIITSVVLSVVAVALFVKFNPVPVEYGNGYVDGLKMGQNLGAKAVVEQAEKDSKKGTFVEDVNSKEQWLRVK